METQTWKDIWQIVFFVASALFYLTVLFVFFKGFGDVVEMIKQMLSGKKPHAKE